MKCWETPTVSCQHSTLSLILREGWQHAILPVVCTTPSSESLWSVGQDGVAHLLRVTPFLSSLSSSSLGASSFVVMEIWHKG